MQPPFVTNFSIDIIENDKGELSILEFNLGRLSGKKGYDKARGYNSPSMESLISNFYRTTVREMCAGVIENIDYLSEYFPEKGILDFTDLRQHYVFADICSPLMTAHSRQDIVVLDVAPNLNAIYADKAIAGFYLNQYCQDLALQQHLVPFNDDVASNILALDVKDPFVIKAPTSFQGKGVVVTNKTVLESDYKNFLGKLILNADYNNNSAPMPYDFPVNKVLVVQPAIPSKTVKNILHDYHTVIRVFGTAIGDKGNVTVHFHGQPYHKFASHPADGKSSENRLITEVAENFFSRKAKLHEEGDRIFDMLEKPLSTFFREVTGKSTGNLINDFMTSPEIGEQYLGGVLFETFQAQSSRESHR